MSKKNFSKAHGRMIYPGQVWVPPNSRGDPWRIMAVAEGYSMGRYKGCVPGVIAINPGMDDWAIASSQHQTDGEQ